jgi:polar amino acid transport system substrate-binding protein
MPAGLLASTLGGLALLVASVAPVAAGPALDRVRDSGILVAAADPVWPPFSWRDPIGEFHGFDVEVTREIADRLGARAEFVTPSWEEQVAGDWNGQWDIAVTNMTPTAERSQRLAFPAIYTYGLAVLAVNADDATIADVPQASGKRIAVVEDTLYAMYLRREDMGVEGLATVVHRIDDAEIVEYANSAAQYRSVYQDHQADGVIDDISAVKAQIFQGRELRIVGEPLFASPAAVAIEAGDPEFAAEIARIVAELHADGTLRSLSLKWLDMDATVAGG